jgi:hypothetical protein
LFYVLKCYLCWLLFHGLLLQDLDIIMWYSLSIYTYAYTHIHIHVHVCGVHLCIVLFNSDFFGWPIYYWELSNVSFYFCWGSIFTFMPSKCLFYEISYTNIWYTCVYNCYVFLMDCSLYWYEVNFISSNFGLKSALTDMSIDSSACFRVSFA